MNAKAYGLTDVGRRREANEDEFLLDDGLGLYAVADGMGGHAAGEVASHLAISTLRESLTSSGWEGAETETDVARAQEALRQAVDEANRKICETVMSREEWRGMGTTVVILLACGERALIGHVGDSRAYLLRNGDFRRLTSDHSWVNEQVKLGLLTEEQAHRHPMRNIVTRALGNRLDVALELNNETFRGGDVFLLCSDGLNSMLSDEEIRTTLEANPDPRDACRALVDAANARGGEDNTTVIVLKVNGNPRT